MHMGGTPEGTAHAREDSWREMLAFADANLVRRPGSSETAVRHNP